ncbi:peroxisomal assembly protein [Rhizina undulata]
MAPIPPLSITAPGSLPADPLLPPTKTISLRRRRKNPTPIAAKLQVTELRGDVGFVSEDIWRDVFGFRKEEVKGLVDGEEQEEEAIPPTLHIALTLINSSLFGPKKYTILPVTLLPNSSQFPRLDPSTILLPSSIVLPESLSAANAKVKKPLAVLATDVVPVGLETVIVTVRVPVSDEDEEEISHFQEEDDDLEDRVKEALGKLQVIRSGEELLLNYGHNALGGKKAKISLCEPVDQGLLKPDTKIVVLKDKLHSRKRRRGGEVDGIILDGEGVHDDESDDIGDENGEEDEDALEFSTFLTAPQTSAALGFSSISPTPLRNGYHSPNPAKTNSSASSGKEFKPQPLTLPIPSSILHPKPKDHEDEEARVFVRVKDLAKLGCFSGDWVRMSVSLEEHSQDPHSLQTAAETVAKSRGGATSQSGRNANGGRSRDVSVVPTEKMEVEIGRPVRIYSLPEGWEIAPRNGEKKKRRHGKGKASDAEADRIVYLSPILLSNISLHPAAKLIIAPFFAATTAPLTPTTPSFPPSAKEVTLLRIASPSATDRALLPSLLLQLKSYFESARRLVKQGDLIPACVDEVLARSLYGEAPEEGITEELLTGSVEEGKGGKRNCIAWFRVGNIVSSASSEEVNGEKPPPSRREKKDSANVPEEDVWGGVVFVDPASTRMVQAGSEKRKVPGTLSSTWEYYLRLLPPPVRIAEAENVPAALVVPKSYVNPVHRRLRELISAATSPRAISLGLQPIAILLTSTQRAIGKKTIATQAAKEVGVHIFHIDAYDIISDGGAGDTKTEAFLRARVERAGTCGKECCVLLISHIEALTAPRMGEVLKELISGMRIVVATTTEVEKVSEGIRNAFTHEMEIGAPDEKERASLLERIVDDRMVRLGKDVEIPGVAVKTAALVAGDLVDVVERAVAASRDRVKSLGIRLREKQKQSIDFSPETKEKSPLVTVADLEIAGGDSVTTIMKPDFDLAVDAARRNFADSIGAPKIPNVTWDDVGGLSNVKSAVMETIQLPLERPELFAKGMKKRSGILFYGPPGTGKTLLAKAIATEFSLNFFSVKGPELLNMYIGESEANVRRVFQRARDARPCVVFFDELDSVAPKRGNQGDSGGVMDRIVSQLLAELDGMSEGAEGSGGVFVIGATNRPDLLDAALLRPGRFDKMLYLGVSDTHDKQLTILEALTRKFTLDPSLSLKKVADALPFTYTGADLYALCSDAMLKAITRQANLVDEKINSMPDKPSTAYFFDRLATKEDVMVVVREEDFWEAKNELVGSVSAKELEHYQRVREQFETVVTETPAPPTDPAQNPPQFVIEAQPPALSLSLAAHGKGKGREILPAIEEDASQEGGEDEDGTRNGMGEEGGNDDEDLYGDDAGA